MWEGVFPCGSVSVNCVLCLFDFAVWLLLVCAYVDVRIDVRRRKGVECGRCVSIVVRFR